MKIPSVYLDTSVIGGCFDSEFKIWSNGLIDDIRHSLFIGVISELVEAEISDAPMIIQEKYFEFLSLNPKMIKLNEESFALVEIYLMQQILPERFLNDMLHIALATVAEVDILASWNFRHIVRYDKIRQFNAVNLRQGYHILEVYSPREVTSYGKE